MRLRFAFLALAWLALAAQASLPPPPEADAILVGEQHDAAAHPGLQRDWVERLAGAGRLAALALEMAEQGASTSGLAPAASEAEVRQALRWDDAAWPWERYGPAVMAAVRAGVPVLGANLPRAQLRATMADATLDHLLSGPARKAQEQAIRQGHCDLLPESQVGPMTRVQVARDKAMADTVAGAAAPGKTVLLLAGARHVEPGVGVPLHLPPRLRAAPLMLPPEATGKDYCGPLRERFGPPR